MKDKIEVPEKGKWIYWRWKVGGSPTWSKDYVQNVDGDIIELSDWDFWSKYPTRVLISEIEFRQTTKS